MVPSGKTTCKIDVENPTICSFPPGDPLGNGNLVHHGLYSPSPEPSPDGGFIGFASLNPCFVENAY